MKQVLILLSILTSGFYAVAQPVLQATDINPVPGDYIYTYNCNTTGITNGAAGANVTWDFSTLSSYSVDTTSYSSCSSTVFCDSFPGSTISAFTNHNYSYFISDANRLAINGILSDSIATGGAGNLFIHYSSPEDAIYYPLSYNSKHADNWSSSTFFGSFEEYAVGIDSFNCDGYGTLKLPSGVFNNVLRVHRVSIRRDSTNIIIPSSSRTESYDWFVSGFHNPVLTLTYDTSGSAGNVPYISELAYLSKFSVGVSNEPFNVPKITIYPNPCSDKLAVSGLSSGDQLCISDITGRMIYKRIVFANQVEQINTSNFASGMYVFSVTGSDSKTRHLPFTKE